MNVAVADLGNGHVDIVTANEVGNSVSVLLGNGAGTFTQTQLPYPVGTQPMAVAIGHFFGGVDTPLDIVTANYLGNSISLLQSNGNGTFSLRLDIPIVAPSPSGPSSADSHPTAVAVADFNGDGQDDIVTANDGVQGVTVPSVTVLISNAIGSYGLEQTFPTLSDTQDIDQPTAVVAADFDGDGHPDIVVAKPGFESVGVFSGNGDGTFSSRVDYFAGGDPTALAFGNLTGDQTSLGLDRLDLVAVGRYDTQASILLGQKYSTSTTISASVSTSTYGSSITLNYGVAAGGAPSAFNLTGSFQLYVNGTPLDAPIPLGGNSSATTTLTNIPAGTQDSLTVLYVGDDDFLQSLSTPVVVNVVQAQLTVTANDSWMYGDPTVLDSWGITGLVNGDTQEDAEVVGGAESFDYRQREQPRG